MPTETDDVYQGLGAYYNMSSSGSYTKKLDPEYIDFEKANITQYIKSDELILTPSTIIKYPIMQYEPISSSTDMSFTDLTPDNSYSFGFSVSDSRGNYAIAKIKFTLEKAGTLGVYLKNPYNHSAVRSYTTLPIPEAEDTGNPFTLDTVNDSSVSKWIDRYSNATAYTTTRTMQPGVYYIYAKFIDTRSSGYTSYNYALKFGFTETGNSAITSEWNFTLPEYITLIFNKNLEIGQGGAF